MKMKITKKTICLAAALVLLGSLTVGTALAYFTTYTQAEGGIVLDLGFTETIPEENVVNGAKQVTIKNTGDYECYVRMKALVGDSYTISYTEPGAEGKWTPGAEGFYYYSDILAPKTGESSRIDVNISFPEVKDGKAPAFNVIIIQECTPVLYDNEGNPYADWTKVADVNKTVVSGEEDIAQ